MLLTFIQSNAITKAANLAIGIVARLPIIDAIAVANVKTKLGAVPPDGVLHEPRKHGREGRIEGLCSATTATMSAQPPGW